MYSTMEGSGDILIACSVDDLFWLKRSLKGREKFIGTIINKEGLTPLHVAAQHLHINSLKYILSRCGSNVDISIATDNTGDTPLHLALKKLNKSSQDIAFQCVKFLIENGSHCNRQNKKGQTPLHIAASIGLPPVIELLLSHGANFTITDNNGHTPCDIATLYGHYEIARILRALQWAKEKDSIKRSELQVEKLQREQEEICIAIASESRKQVAEESYTAWLCQKNVSSIDPPRNAMSRLHKRQQLNKLQCTSCPKTMDDTTVAESKVMGQSDASASMYSSQCLLHGDHNINVKVAPIQISLKQSSHNIEAIGKPSMMFPYTNYPPASYKQNYLRQARSKSVRPTSSMSTHSRRPRSRAIKSAPTPRIVHTPEPSTLTSLKEYSVAGKKRNSKKKKSTEDDNNFNKVNSTIISPSTDVQDKPSQQKSESNETETEMSGTSVEVMKPFIDLKDETNTDASLKITKQEETMDGIEATDPLEEGDGSSSSIDLTFHEVGPENSLQSLASAVVTAGSLSPMELLKILRISNSSRLKNHNFKRSLSYPTRPQRHSLSAIPEGEIVTEYGDEEGSQYSLDAEFLHSLMPYAFEDTDFQEVGEKEITQILANNERTEHITSACTTSVGTVSTAQEISDTEKSLVVAWGDDNGISLQSNSESSTTKQTSQGSEHSKKTLLHTKRKVHSAMPRLHHCSLRQENKTAVKTSVVQFGGTGELKYYTS